MTEDVHELEAHTTNRCVVVRWSVWLLRPGEEGSLDISMGDWKTALEIAIKYGWKPCGTELDYIEGWEGSYVMNNDQLVTTEDAANLAEALARSLSDQFEQLRDSGLRHVFEKFEESARLVKVARNYVRRGAFSIG